MSDPMVSITKINRATQQELYTETIPLKRWYGRHTNDQVRRLVGDVQAIPRGKAVTVLGSDMEVYKVAYVPSA